MTLDQAIAAHLSEMIAFRQRLHQSPELAFQEHETAQLIRQKLEALGIRYIAGVEKAPTATIAHIGNESHPCVALRADIDALPIEERTSLPYASTRPGIMHACGHDGHAATLMLVAAALKQLEASLQVCVKLIWQPAEESGGGAKRLVEAGVVDGRISPRPAAIFGLHGWPMAPLGIALSRPGALKAASDRFAVTFRGKGAHAARPHQGRDPIVCAAQTFVSLQTIVSREIDPTEPAVVTVGRINAGTADNIIPDTATVGGTIRTLSEAARKTCQDAIQRLAAGIAAAAGCTSETTFSEGYPVLANDPRSYDYAARIARQTLGEGAFQVQEAASMGAEDFAFYLQQVPGCFLNLGLRPTGAADFPGLHNEHFNYNDAAIEPAARLLAALAINYKTHS